MSPPSALSAPSRAPPPRHFVTTPLSVMLTVGSTSRQLLRGYEGTRAPIAMGDWCPARGHRSSAVPVDPARPAPAQGEHLNTRVSRGTRRRIRPRGPRATSRRSEPPGRTGWRQPPRTAVGPHSLPAPSSNAAAALTSAQTSTPVSRPDPQCQLRCPRRLWDAQGPCCHRHWTPSLRVQRTDTDLSARVSSVSSSDRTTSTADPPGARPLTVVRDGAGSVRWRRNLGRVATAAS